ncbi:MAG TPA: amino acid adenylation domain-containing protein [Longimicrobiaceae bacterium]|nr:amino acid adenylation domain-containing protein [Longimicrobiaceae bacterium]
MPGRRPERAPAPADAPPEEAAAADATLLYSRPALATPYAAPSTETERRVAETWQETLGIGRVGVHDDFFSLGGHSLFATQIISRLRDAFRVELSLSSLFDTPTVAGLAARIDELRLTAPAVELDPIVPVPHDRPLPLSFQQLRMWLLDRMEPGNPFYNVPTAYPFRGRLELAAARRALETVVERHAVLRTVYRAGDGPEPVQVILPPARVPLPVTDLRGVAGDRRREDEAWRLARAESELPFDLAEGSFRVGLLRLGDDDWVLLTTVHHIATDGWSSGIFFEEWLRAYAAFTRGESPRLPELPVQYADFAVWQRAWLTGEVLEEQVGYWKERLAGAPLALELPTDRVRPPVRSYRGAQYRMNVSPALKEALEALCAREGVTLFILLMAAFKVLLGRYSGQDDLVVGTVDANRARPETEPLLGFFINTLPIRSSLAGDPTLLELLARVRDAALGAYAHAELPLEKLLEELKLERDLSRNPLIQVMFGFERPIPHFSDANPELGLRRVEREDRGLTESGTAKFDLDFLLREHPDDGTFSGAVGYNLDLFDPATAERLMVNYVALLERVAADPELRLSELEVMSPAERETVLARFNDTALPFPAAPPVHGLFAAVARRIPDAPALLHGAEAVTYAELDARSARVARALRRRGVGPETPVGVCLERGPGLPAALLGVLRAGGAFVPLDPAHPDDRIGRVLRDAGVRVLLTGRGLRERLAPLAPETLELDGPEVAAEDGEAPEAEVHPGSLAYVIYTSGSTGEPKGVGVEHLSLLDTLLGAAERFGAREGDVMPSLASHTFDIWLLETLLPLLAGGAVRTVPAAHVTDVDALLAEAEDATLLHAVPALMRQLAGALAAAGRTLPRLRRAFVGGDAVPAELLEEMRCVLPAAELHVLYGPTEGGIICTSHHSREARPERHLLGSPLPNARVYVCDAAGRPLPIGVPGELLLGGPGLARGYGGRPGATAERWVPDPFGGEPGARLYRTGDRARWRADGVLEFMGRTDEQVKVRGYRIEPGEVEAAMLRHGAAREAVVVLREGRLVGYYTADGALDAAELRARLRTVLPEYMVPAALVPLDALPLTPTGKVDRPALPAPEPAAPAAGHVAPRDATERALAEVWREVLRVERVGVHDNFFELGGDSILSIQAVARARGAGLELKPRHFFEHPTIAGLAALAAGDGAGGRGAHGPAAPFALAGVEPEALAALAPDGDLEDAYPLTPMQEGMLFHVLFAPGEGGYVGQSVFTLAGDVEVDALRRAWQGAVDRHPALRTGFAWEGVERPLQLVHRRAELPFRVEDWRGSPEAERAARLDRWLGEDRAAGFDLAGAPLMRLTLFRLEDAAYRVVWTHHHLVTDGWSIPLLFRDVVALYDAATRGADAGLPPAPPYRDYVAWLERRDAAGAEGFWREALAGFAAPTPLELRRPDAPAEDGPRYGRARVETGPEEAQALHALARRWRLTPSTLVQGAWALLLSRFAGEEDVLFGAVVSGRPGELPGVEEMVGLFINTVPVRARAADGERLPEWLAGIQRHLAAAAEHAYTPLVQLRAWSDVPATLPLFESLVAFQNQPMEDVLAGAERSLSVRDWEGTEQADLPLTLVAGLRDRLLVEAEYLRDRFDPAAVELLLARLRALLAEMAAAPESTLGELGLLRGAERRQVLEAWGGAPAEPPRAPVHEAFAARAREHPDALAVELGDERLSYGELEARANRLAGALRRRGAVPEARVALYLERGPEMVVALLAVLKAGAAFVPLDPAYRSERLARILRDAAPRVLLTTSALEGTLDAGGVPALRLDADRDELAREGADAPAGGVAPESLAYVIHTSGSTGEPKGVAVPHGALAAMVAAAARLHGVGPGTRLLQAYSLGFDPAVLDVFMALTTGASLHLASREDQLSGERLAGLLREREITAAALAPALLGAMPDAELPALRTVIAGGDVTPPETVARWSRGRSFWIAYGPTETTVVATALEAAGPDPAAPLGRPLPGVRVYVVDRADRPVPSGVPGELLVGGAGVARGYLGRPDLTAERFVPDPFGGRPGARLYRTGDRVRWRAVGSLEFLGRLDQQVKVRGFRIEPGEVEAALREHPAVRDAVVAAGTDAAGERRLAAYVTPADVPVDALRAHARAKLPEHMVPAAWVALDALPLAPSGKVDRRALPAPGSLAAAEYVAPRTPTEELLADIVAAVLGLERVGVHDGFFDIGGHSLLATRVLARIRAAFGIDLPMRALFEAPTVAGLAERLAAAEPDSAGAGALGAALERLEELSDEEVMRLLGEE